MRVLGLLAGAFLLSGAGRQDFDAEKLFEESSRLRADKKYAEALRGFARIAASDAPGWHPEYSAFYAACVCAVTGKKDQALDWLEKAFELGYRDAAALEAEEDLASLEEEERYKGVQARLLRMRDGGPPSGEPLGVLRLNGEELELVTEAGPRPARGEYLAYQVLRDGLPAYLLTGLGSGLVRITESGADGEVVAELSPEITANREVLPLPDLVWQALLLQQWEKRGDRLLEEAEKASAPLEAAYAALEAAIHPLLLRRGVYDKLAEPVLKLMKDPATPRPVLAGAARSISRLPDDDGVEETGDLTLARACAYFFLRCYPRAAESLKKIEGVEDAGGLREVLKALGVNDWTPGPGRTIGGRAAAVWVSQGKPDDPELPVYESCVSVRVGGEPRSFLLTRRTIAGGPSYFLHAAGAGSERLIEAFGKTKPSDEDLDARISRDLQGTKAAPVAAALPPLGKGEPGRVELRWRGLNRLESVELRREALEAGVCLAETMSPVMIKGLPPGVYVAVRRDARGRALAERRISVESGGRVVLDVDRF